MFASQRDPVLVPQKQGEAWSVETSGTPVGRPHDVRLLQVCDNWSYGVGEGALQVPERFFHIIPWNKYQVKQHVNPDLGLPVIRVIVGRL